MSSPHLTRDRTAVDVFTVSVEFSIVFYTIRFPFFGRLIDRMADFSTGSLRTDVVR